MVSLEQSLLGGKSQDMSRDSQSESKREVWSTENTYGEAASWLFGRG